MYGWKHSLAYQAYFILAANFILGLFVGVCCFICWISSESERTKINNTFFHDGNVTRVKTRGSGL